MQRFSINSENQIEVISEDDVLAEGTSAFCSEEELLELSTGWPAARLAEIWNGLAGVATVRKFASRAAGCARIWEYIQNLTPAEKVSTQAEDAGVAPGHGKAETPVAEDGVPEGDTTEPVSKKEQVVALLRAEAGITLTELMSATGWQKHSVRGFLSGTVVRKMGLKVLSFVNEEGERAYKLA